MRVGLLTILVLLAGVAHAAEADDAALTAYTVHDENCAAVAAGETSSATAEQQAVVTDAWRKVITAYEVTGRSYLLYWRGVLSQCLDQEDRAAKDLQLFIELEQFDDRFSALVKDSRTRLRRMKVEVREPGQLELEAARQAKSEGGEYSLARDAPALKPAKRKVLLPFFTVGASGGYLRFDSFNYAGASIDFSLKLKGPLRVTLAVRPSWPTTWSTEEEDATTGEVVPTGLTTRSTVLLDFAAGLELLFGAGPVRPRVAALIHGAPNPNHAGMVAQNQERTAAGDTAPTVLPEVLVGGALQGGLDVPLGSEVVALRIAGEIGNLGPTFEARVSGGFVLGLPGPRRVR